jgi:NAD(P)-dependent dehydrogenase (short-subunit alcohol dehydrogenase family)
MSFGIENPVALVTGGASGIGAAIATRLAADGARVHVLDLAEAPGHVSHVCDISVESEVRAVAAEVGGVDILVNVAGIHVGRTTVWEMKDGLFERLLAVNLNGAYYTSRAVLPGMIERGWGRIVNMSSISARDGVGGSAAYAASKAGLVGLTRAIAKEVATAGILVNCVAPGSIDTPMLNASGNRAQGGASSPMGRLGQPEEVAALVSWLCSSECSFSTGTVYDISGGRAMW